MYMALLTSAFFVALLSILVIYKLCTSSFCTVFVPRSKILAFYAGQVVEKVDYGLLRFTIVDT